MLILGMLRFRHGCMRPIEESENFTHLPNESIDVLLQQFTVVVNNMRANVDAQKNMRANVDVLSYDDHDRAVKHIHTCWYFLTSMLSYRFPTTMPKISKW
jgi:hypothetical protein